MDRAQQRQATIRSAAGRIDQLAGTVLAQVPRMEDKTPWWGRLLSWLAIAAAVAGAVYLIHATGAIGFLRLGAAWLRSLLPSPTTSRAKLDAKATAAGLDPSRREAIAAARTDPIYDAAYRREQRRRPQRKEPG